MTEKKPKKLPSLKGASIVINQGRAFLKLESQTSSTLVPFNLMKANANVDNAAVDSFLWMHGRGNLGKPHLKKTNERASRVSK